MKKSIKDLNYKFFKNIVLSSSLGICASCNNNTVNKNDQDNVKGDSSEDGDEEDTGKKTIGSRRKRKDNNDSEFKLDSKNSPDLIKEEKSGENSEEDVEILKQLDAFESDRAIGLKTRRSLEINILKNLYVSRDHFVFQIISDDKVVLICLDEEENFEAENIDFPEKVRIEGNTYFVSRIGYNAFSNCYKIKNVNLPSSIINIDRSAFENCTSLQSISIKQGGTEIGNWAFENCKSLSIIALPNGVKKIGDGVFKNCTGLTSVSIPQGL